MILFYNLYYSSMTGRTAISCVSLGKTTQKHIWTKLSGWINYMLGTSQILSADFEDGSWLVSLVTILQPFLHS